MQALNGVGEAGREGEREEGGKGKGEGVDKCERERGRVYAVNQLLCPP